MTVFEPGSCGIGSDCDVDSATTSFTLYCFLKSCFRVVTLLRFFRLLHGQVPLQIRDAQNILSCQGQWGARLKQHDRNYHLQFRFRFPSVFFISKFYALIFFLECSFEPARPMQACCGNGRRKYNLKHFETHQSDD